ncbi:hypothetical protein NADRNF5_0494 [Nitrosopumilus adriaticus]|uniref:Uncharacterized protein n=1 Tax=Nitrosopumilus adriaticus TaxID=1580092 RepID=A0A0D5C1I2_9ARCH|nr:hypothetical protein NADRNF5_0494 [Nitrosopumilus adriaticus]
MSLVDSLDRTNLDKEERDVSQFLLKFIILRSNSETILL